MSRHPQNENDNDFLRSLVDSLESSASDGRRKPRPIPFKKKSPKREAAATKPLAILRDVTNARLPLPVSVPKQRLEEEHAALLEGLDESFFTYVPTPDPSPVKAKPVKLETTSLPFTKLNQPKSFPAVKNVKQEDIDFLMHGMEDWDWTDMEHEASVDVKKEAGSAVSVHAPPSRPKEPCARCVVENIEELQTDRRSEKHLHVRIDGTIERALVILRDDWASTPIQTGDILNILGPFLPPPSSYSSTLSAVALTSSSNILIHHPDILLPPTLVSTSSACMRKPLVSQLIRSAPGGQDGIARSILWGNLLHEVVQRCLSSPASSTGDGWSPALIANTLDDVLYSRDGVEGCFRAGLSLSEALAELKQRAGGLEGFSRRFIGTQPKREATLTDSQNSDSWVALNRTRGIEEDIWSPTYGLKGKIDASVQVAISTPLPSVLVRKGKDREVIQCTMPFEIKTGRASKGMEHRAQTVLYTLLIAERYEAEVPAGLLYYTQSDEVIHVPVRRNEMRALIMARNELAEWTMRRRRGLDAICGRNGGRKFEATLEESGETSIITKPDRLAEDSTALEAAFLPAPIDDEWACKKCYALDTCMLYRKAIDAPSEVPAAMEDLFEQKTGHLTTVHTTFFRRWERLISLEENDLHRFRRELWTMTAEARESAGRCFAGMVLVPLRPQDEVNGVSSKIHRHTVRFVKRGGEGTTLLNGHISTGDAIVVSVVGGMLALARGFVLALEPESVLLGLDHALDAETLQDLPSIGSINSRTLFRIDKDELSSGVGRLRDNLARLFYASGGDDKRRSLVVDLAPPSFSGSFAPTAHELSSSLNAPQRKAMEKVATATDYALILGMPGTGKTSTIAEIIKMLVRRGKSVLLTSYTHSAVDTILLRLGDVDFKVLRLGNVDKVHPDMRKYTVTSLPQATTVEQLEYQLLSPPVVATTCLSIDHPLFSRRTFDYCIVDEASQITLPTCIGPLRFADVFVLVGDHFQLPPLVRNREARKGGLDVSLFRRLSDAHTEAVVDLTYQYRMNEDIMLVSNRLIYGSRLRCGSEEVAKRSLRLPSLSSLHQLHSVEPCQDCWLNALLHESCKAVFVDTDALPARDSRVGDLVQNEVEAQLVFQVGEMLLRCGLKEEELGIISLYRQQVKLLSHMFKTRSSVEVLTADRSQGRDKDCIIISMVRSNESGELGDLVQDWRRMNVSFTRARSKLIIFGSRQTLQATPLLSDFFDLMEEHSWIYLLRPGAHKLHRSALVPDLNVLQSKRLAEDSDKENQGMAIFPPKKLKTDAGSIEPQPVLRDIINELM